MSPSVILGPTSRRLYGTLLGSRSDLHRVSVRAMTTTTTKVAILDDYQGVASRYFPGEHVTLPPTTSVTVFRDHLKENDERLVERLEPFHVILGMRERTPFPRALLERLPNLRLLLTTGMHNASFDLEAAKDLGIRVAGCPGRAGFTGTAETTWTLILALAKNLERERASVRNGGWQVTVGRGLEGATLGIIGLGKIGELVAQVGKVFGMKVVAWSQNLTEEKASEHGVDKAKSLKDLLERADLYVGADSLSLSFECLICLYMYLWTALRST
jgi:lactate dehydrogenase-like 2-hydroxyacid dehydrogenase